MNPILEVNLALRKEIDLLKSTITRQSDTISKQVEEINRLKNLDIKTDFRKSYQAMSSRNKLNARSEIQKVFNRINLSLSQKLNLQIFSIEFGNKVNSDPYKLLFLENCENEEKGVDYYLYIKDRFNLSDKTYQVIRNFYTNKIPSLSRIKEERIQLNKSLNIKKIDDGYYIEPIQKINFHIEKFLKENNIL